MAYIPFLIICITLLLPVLLPLIYWYILRKRESNIYGYCRYARRFWAVIIIIMLSIKLFKLPERETYNAYEVIGEFLGQFLMSFLLWKRWKNDEGIERNEEVLNEQN